MTQSSCSRSFDILENHIDIMLVLSARLMAFDHDFQTSMN